MECNKQATFIKLGKDVIGVDIKVIEFRSTIEER